jgi:uncharacterized membrane protein YdjX (TVP38/TMEM64 family)
VRKVSRRRELRHGILKVGVSPPYDRPVVKFLTASFLLARFVFRDMAADLIGKHPTMLAVDRAVGNRGLRIVLLMRLSPIVPFNVMNYMSGATSLDVRDFVLG